MTSGRCIDAGDFEIFEKGARECVHPMITGNVARGERKQIKGEARG